MRNDGLSGYSTVFFILQKVKAVKEAREQIIITERTVPANELLRLLSRSEHCGAEFVYMIYAKLNKTNSSQLENAVSTQKLCCQYSIITSGPNLMMWATFVTHETLIQS